MRRRMSNPSILPLAPTDLALFLLCACFLIGYLSAVVLLGRLGDPGSRGLLLCLSALLPKEGGIPAPGWAALLWGVLRWPVVLILLHYTAAGLAIVPLLFCVRGFLLTFSVGMFASLMPGGGLLTAFVLFGLSELLQLPVFFLLGTRSLMGAAALRRAAFSGQSCDRIQPQLSLPRCAVCAAALAGAVCAEYRVVPPLLSGLAAAGIF